MSKYIYWPGSGSSPVGLTPMGFYDNDADFQHDAPRVADWAARRLGYPIVAVEQTDYGFYALFEEAINEYSHQVNAINIRDNLFNVYGQSTEHELTNKKLRNTLGRIITLTDVYGEEVGVGGQITWHSGSIRVKETVQNYDLNAWADANNITGSIKIRRIFHFNYPASMKTYDPFGLPLTPYSIMGYGNAYGYNGILGSGTMFVLRPVYEDLLRMQVIEISDQVRKSGYGFELINNRLKLFPVPDHDFNLWFDYTLSSEADNPIDNTIQNPITDSSNIPYEHLTYSKINSYGKQWIRSYFLALCKITIGGAIRNKYSTIPISNDKDVQLSSEIYAEGKDEKEKLLQELKEFLEKTTKAAQLEMKAMESENLTKILNRFPLKIYIG